MMNHYILGFFNILFNYLTYNYLEQFEKLNCKCSMNAKRDMSKVMLLTFYVIIFGKIIYPDLPQTAHIATIIYTLIFDLVFVSYIYELKGNECSCGDNLQDTTTSVIYTYYLLLTFLIISSILMLLLSKMLSNLK